MHPYKITPVVKNTNCLKYRETLCGLLKDVSRERERDTYTHAKNLFSRLRRKMRCELGIKYAERCLYLLLTGMYREGRSANIVPWRWRRPSVRRGSRWRTLHLTTIAAAFPLFRPELNWFNRTHSGSFFVRLWALSLETQLTSCTLWSHLHASSKRLLFFFFLKISFSRHSSLSYLKRITLISLVGLGLQAWEGGRLYQYCHCGDRQI